MQLAPQAHHVIVKRVKVFLGDRKNGGLNEKDAILERKMEGMEAIDNTIFRERRQ